VATQAPQPAATPTPGPAVTQPQAPVGPGTTSVILSPTGHHYRAGEFCPEADLGKSTVDDHGTGITCIRESGGYHWHY
jgi:hypothetical protein